MRKSSAEGAHLSQSRMHYGVQVSSVNVLCCDSSSSSVDDDEGFRTDSPFNGQSRFSFTARPVCLRSPPTQSVSPPRLSIATCTHETAGDTDEISFGEITSGEFLLSNKHRQHGPGLPRPTTAAWVPLPTMKISLTQPPPSAKPIESASPASSARFGALAMAKVIWALTTMIVLALHSPVRVAGVYSR